MVKDKWHYFVGDIHGCFDEYLQLEAQINRHAARNKVEPFIVSVGDMVDRGPKSAEVIRHFRLGAEAGSHAAVVGNHEAFLIASFWHFAPWDERLGPFPLWLRSFELRHESEEGYARVLSLDDYSSFSRCLWLGQGGFETLESFGCDPQAQDDWTIEPDDLAFLIHLPLFWENDDFVVTHALVSQEELSLVRDFEPRKEEESILSWFERLTNYRTASYQAIWRREAPDAPADPNRMHISGHSVFDRVKRRKALQTIQIDTGCVYGYRLTAWCGESGRYFRVKASN